MNKVLGLIPARGGSEGDLHASGQSALSHAVLLSRFSDAAKSEFLRETGAAGCCYLEHSDGGWMGRSRLQTETDSDAEGVVEGQESFSVRCRADYLLFPGCSCGSSCLCILGNRNWGHCALHGIGRHRGCPLRHSGRWQREAESWPIDGGGMI